MSISRRFAAKIKLAFALQTCIHKSHDISIVKKFLFWVHFLRIYISRCSNKCVRYSYKGGVNEVVKQTLSLGPLFKLVVSSFWVTFYFCL
ncbi:hypothetical protein VNO77_04908 [Canavalia gladiata]|uniref:Uncharacterized protein n=1 Tax=Canavalia gladiata TaxID=3824 RepID=A0AAN9MZE0_CANGL